MTPWIVPTRLLCPWEFPCRNTGVVSYSLLQGRRALHYSDREDQADPCALPAPLGKDQAEEFIKEKAGDYGIVISGFSFYVCPEGTPKLPCNGNITRRTAAFHAPGWAHITLRSNISPNQSLRDRFFRMPSYRFGRSARFCRPGTARRCSCRASRS